MKFRVKITKLELDAIGGQPAVKVTAVSTQEPGSVIVTMGVNQAEDFNVGDIVMAEVRLKRGDE